MFVNSAVALSSTPRTKQCLANGPSGLGGSSMADDTLLNVKQVAQYLQLKESTIYSWAQDGKIPAIKIGRTWRFRRSDLDDWLEQHLQAGDQGDLEE